MPQTLKILIATGIYPPDIGGPATMIEALAKSLLERGFGVEIITYAAKGGIEINKNGIRLIKVGRNQNNLFSHISYFGQLIKAAKNADIIYATDLYSVGYFSYLLKKIFGKKYIIRFAGDSAWEAAVSSGETKDYIVDFQEKKYSSKIEKLKKRRRKILLAANKVIAVSNFLAGIAQKIGVENGKIQVVYNSIDFWDYPEDLENVGEIRKKYGDNKKIILTICRLALWKGVDGIIKIIPSLKEKIGGISFLVLGIGPELEGLQKLAENFGVSADVHFLGKIRRRQILNYLTAADVFVLNANYEGFSHALLEAMKAGAPVVATSRGGNPEAIENNKEGILVGYNNRGELLAAILRVLGDKAFAGNLAARAKEKLKRFNWEKVINETEKILKEAGQNE
jgi:glycosyltransferase involved in cell wall biosynthesis